MKRILCAWLFVATCLVWLDGMAAAPASEHQKTVGGIIVNIGVVPAGQAAVFAGEKAAHTAVYPSGAQHLVVSLSDSKTGTRVADAQVVVEVKDPRGKIERKNLVSAITAGAPDYSEIFRFDWSGKYAIQVSVTPKGGTKARVARLTWVHVI